MLCFAACGPDESPESVARTGCLARYDNLQRWIQVHARLPETEAELAAAIDRSEADPWGNAYQVEVSGANYSIWSNGPDGEERTADDISFPPDAD